MRISYVFDHRLPSTGADTEQLVHMVSALGETGAEVELVLPRIVGTPSPTPEDLAAYYGVAPTFTVRTLRGPFPTVRPVEKTGHAMAAAACPRVRASDLVYTRNLPTVLSLWARRGPAVVFETYRPWPDQVPALAPLFRALGRGRDRLRLVLHSAYAARSYRAAGFPEARMLVAHNGWDPAKFEPRLDGPTARRRLGLPPEGPLVVYTGRVTPRKGLLGVLEMARARPGVRFVLVGSEGDGPVEQRARRLANVIVRPWTKLGKLAPYLYAADVLLIPPTQGPLTRVGNTVLPIKTFPYMASGRPILAPRTPDLLELLRHGENAFLVEPDDWPAATAALDRLLADAPLRRRIAETARAEAEGRTWRARAERVLAFARAMTGA